jgi:hypothetical protein
MQFPLKTEPGELFAVAPDGFGRNVEGDTAGVAFADNGMIPMRL